MALLFSQLFVCASLLAQAEDKQPSLAPLQERVDAASVMLVSRKQQPSEVEATLVAKPIFRYSDALRDIEDAGIWLWTHDQRPVAALKVERYKPGRFKIPWLYCFASLSADLVKAEWADARPFAARKPGIAWQTLKEDPAPTRAARLQQMRKLARQFSAEILKDDAGHDRTQMRILAQPLFRSSESDAVLDGAIFGFTGTGTNPDALLLLDLPAAKESKWRFAIVGMTAEGLRINLNEKVVHESPVTSGKENIFDTWCNFHPDK